MQYLQIYDEVVTKTGRPDLMRETQLAIRQATLRLHSFAFFAKDMTSAEIRFSQPNTTQTLVVSANLMRCRRVLAVMQDGQELTKLESSEIFSLPVARRQDCWWTLGDSLVIRSSKASTTFQLSWLVAPLVEPTANYNSWIAEAHPYAIIDEAAKLVCESVGNLEQASKLAAAVGMYPINGGLASGHVAEILRNNEEI